MCNIIFGRDELPSANVNGSTVTFDVSMKKLIVFVQGEGIENVDLKDSSGTPANRGFDFPARYNEEGNAKLTSWSIDKSLQGQLVFFENCKAGTYNLSYSGTPSSIKVYYEPDVDLEASFYRLSEGGQYVKVDPNKDAIFPGDYMFKLVMKDVDGNETTSNLLGTPQFKTIYRINGKEYTSDSAETRFQVESGDEIGECDFEVTYLNDYTIKRNSAIDFGWKNPIPVILHLVETNCVDSGQSSYGLSEFEGNAKMTFTYSVDGVPLSGDELERVTPEFIIDGLKADYERTDTGFDVKLGLLKPMTETECREYQVVASGRYIDENGKESVVVNPAVVPFSIVNDGYEIALSLEAPQDYFVRSKLKEGDALIAHLTKNGEAMTAEEIEQIELTVDTGGVPYELEKDPENSAIKIKLKDSDSFENGKYDVKCTASIKNNVGAVVSSEDQKTVEIRAYPKWVRYVIALGIIALLAALIAFYMTRKVLPKSIRIDMSQNPVVTKGTKKFGEPVIAPFKGKKRGVLRISFPPNPYLSDGFSFNLVAVDKRHVKSSRRKAMITTGFAGSMYARSVTIGGGQFKKDKNSQKFLNVAGEEQLNETIANGDYVQMTTTDRNGQTFHLKCTLLFK